MPNLKQEYCQTIENVCSNRNTTTKASCSMQNQYKTNDMDNYDHYINSPIKTQQIKSTFQIPITSQQQQQQHLRSPDILATQTCTEVDLVASSLQNPTIYCDLPIASCSKQQQQQFYKPISTILIEDTSSSTIITLSNKENERAQPDGEELKIHDELLTKNELIKNVDIIEDKSKATCDDLDEVMHQISSDLDYLLNGDNELDLLTDKKETTRQHSNINNTMELIEKPTTCKTNSLRRLSKPNLSIEKIDEEDEEEDTEVVIKGILRTKC